MRDVPWALSGYVAASRWLKTLDQKNLDGEEAPVLRLRGQSYS
jgi:hypothetical protein